MGVKLPHFPLHILSYCNFRLSEQVNYKTYQRDISKPDPFLNFVLKSLAYKTLQNLSILYKRSRIISLVKISYAIESLERLLREVACEEKRKLKAVKNF